jgi:tRNA(Arg) A34 adenosine deaminase TadA
MSNNIKYLAFLAEYAKENDPVSGAKVAAAIYVKNSLIILGHNKSKTDPWAARFAKNPDADFPHAEISAIKRTINHFRGEKYARDILESATLYVCRVKRITQYGEYIWGSAKPCSGCMEAIRIYNIKRVVYSLDGTGNYNEI